MPHITQDNKDALKNHSLVEYKMGDVCYLFSQWMLKHYNANPSWTAVHEIKVAVNNPFHNDETHTIILEHLGNMQRVDIQAACELAFFEFYRLIVSRHEDVKILENGNALAGALVPVVPAETIAEVTCYDPTQVVVVPAKKRGRPAGSKNKAKVVA